METLQEVTCDFCHATSPETEFETEFDICNACLNESARERTSKKTQKFYYDED